MAVHAADPHVLQEGVDCILAQTYTDFEFIIIDDKNDATASAFLNSLAHRDSRVRLLKNERNVGLTASLVRGIAVSRGMYVARQDADDISLPDRLAAQVERLDRQQDLALAGTWFAVQSPDRTTTSSRPPDDSEALKRQMFFRNPFCHASAMFRREAYERAGGYDTRFRTTQDLDLWFRLASVGRLGIVERELVWRRLGAGSLSLGPRAWQQVRNGLRIRWRERDQWRGRGGVVVVITATLYHILMTLLPSSGARALGNGIGALRNWRAHLK